jgi:dTDP-glucose 4,6-dehydratase
MPKINSDQWKLEDDFLQIFDDAALPFQKMQGAHIFLTGGTGFIGTWLLEAIRFANVRLQTKVRVTILTRNPGRFEEKFPHLFCADEYRFIAGDIVNLPIAILLSQGPYTHLIHAATDASADMNENNPLQMFDTVVLGTGSVLDFAVQANISRVLYLSSGAVYGQQAPGEEFVSEASTSAPNCINPKNTYAEGKRASEMLCAIYVKQFGLQISIARIFALLGPLLNLNIHFAAGNFIRDALAGKKITVSGDGKPERSYLYPSDLIVWLLAILAHGRPGVAYNVGSEEAVSIADLAKLTSSLLGNHGYEVLALSDSGWNPGRYVPDTYMIRKELGLVQRINLTEAVLRTASWNRLG